VWLASAATVLAAFPRSRSCSPISLLSLPLADYLVAMSSPVAWAEACVEIGIRCGRCLGVACVHPHARRHRRRIVDTEQDYDVVPIQRVRLCDGKTYSLTPVVLWRGRATLPVVLEAGTVAIASGVERTWERQRATATWSPSRSTLGRWCARVRTLVLEVALPLLGAGMVDPERVALVSILTPEVLASWRRRTGRGLLERVAAAPPARTARVPKRGLHAPSAPPETGGERRPRGAWSRPSPRAPPRRRATGGDET
jgi:hypothetical protein